MLLHIYFHPILKSLLLNQKRFSQTFHTGLRCQHQEWSSLHEKINGLEIRLLFYFTIDTLKVALLSFHSQKKVHKILELNGLEIRQLGNLFRPCIVSSLEQFPQKKSLMQVNFRQPFEFTTIYKFKKEQFPLELVSKELVAILHVYAGGLNFMK